MKYYIKNMVCDRCVMAVRNTLKELGLQPMYVKLGEIELMGGPLSASQLEVLDDRLKRLGFERIDDRKSRLIESVKNVIIQHIHHGREQLKTNWSVLISESIHYEYNYLSHLFSSIEGMTIEQYIIRQKIEKVKELLVYDELSLNEIAWKLGYSSVAHLSSQFKRLTGIAPSVFKKQLARQRSAIDKL